MPAPPRNEPAYKAAAGPLTLATWANKQDDGSVVHNTYIVRTYRVPEAKRDGVEDDGWRKTNSLRQQDLLMAAEMLRLAYFRIALNELRNLLHCDED